MSQQLVKATDYSMHPEQNQNHQLNVLEGLTQENEESKTNRTYKALGDYLNLQESQVKVSIYEEISCDLRSKVDALLKNEVKLKEKLHRCKEQLKEKEAEWVKMKATKEASEAFLIKYQEVLEEKNIIMSKNNELTLRVSTLEREIDERNDWKARYEDEEKKT